MNRKTVLTLIVLVLLTACASNKKLVDTPYNRKHYVEQNLKSRSFRILIDFVKARGEANSVALTEFWLEVDKNHVKSYLPYFGQDYKELNIKEGRRFESNIRDYMERRNDRKHYTLIQFYANSNNDKYNYILCIYDNGKAEIDVQANRRKSIRFSGEME
jgi:hypothetical protein